MLLPKKYPYQLTQEDRNIMNLLSIIGIQDANAAETTATPSTAATTTATTLAPGAPAAHPPAPPGGSIMSLLPTLLIFALVFYFLLIRPQTKRAKEQRKLMESISKDDEVVTIGGLAGKVVRVADNYVVLSVSENVEIVLQKAAISMILPKGTLKSI